MDKTPNQPYAYTNTDLVLIGSSQILKDLEKKFTGRLENSPNVKTLNSFSSSSNKNPYTIDEYLWQLQESSELEEEVLVYSVALILRFFESQKKVGKINFLKLIAAS